MNKQQQVFTATAYILDFMKDSIYAPKGIDYNLLPSDYITDMFVDAYTGIDPEEYIDEAVEVLHIPKSFALLYYDEFTSEIEKAFDYAYTDLLERAYMDQLKDHIESQTYFDCYLTDKGDKTDNFWEAEQVQFKITRKEIVTEWIGLEYLNGLDVQWEIDSIEGQEDWLNDVDYNFKLYLDNIYVYDEWTDVLKDYSEVAYLFHKKVNKKVA